MPERIQTLRSSVKGSRPTGRQPGELYTNFADRQIGVVNASNVATDLVAVRYFSAAADYAIGDFVIEAGTMYRAKVAITAGAFNAANWDTVATFAAAGGGGFVLKTGDTMTGNLIIAPPAGNPTFTLNAPAGAFTNWIVGQKGGKNRWLLYFGHAGAESGGNAGSDFYLFKYADDGTTATSVLDINRATGVINMPLGATSVTPPVGDNDTSVATTQFVTRADASAPVVPKMLAGVDTTTNWNTLTTAGYHSAALRGDAVNNGPGSIGYFYLQTFAHLPAGYFTQMAYPAWDASWGIWTRSCNNGVWSAWRQLAPATADTRNRIVNPAFQISQENGTTFVGNGAYPVDQFQLQTSIPTVVAQKIAFVAGHPQTFGINTVLSTPKPSLAANDVWQIVQNIEGINIADLRWGTGPAKSIVIRFKGLCSITGTFTLSVRNDTGARHYMAPFTVAVANTWQEFVIPIPGDTTGTWLTDTSKGLIVSWGLAAGSSITGGVAGWNVGTNMAQLPGNTNLAAAVNSFFIADVGLYADPAKTGLAPPWEMPDEAEELRACQRYWQKTYAAFVTQGVTTGNSYLTVHSPAVTPRPGWIMSGADAGICINFPVTPAYANSSGGSAGTINESRVASATVTTLSRYASTATWNGRM
jgi:hypothetical protein